MFPLSYPLAIALLIVPSDDPLSLPHFSDLRPTIQSVAIQSEILDPREVRYVLTRGEDFDADLKLLRRRWRDLEDAPPLHDAMKFPHRNHINDLLSFNRAYRQNLDTRQPLEMVYWWEIREAIQEADRLYQIWDTARDARCDYYYITVRRQALKKLRGMIGYEAYCSGLMPPHIPIHRFRRID